MLWPRRVVVPAEKTKAKDAVLPVLNKRTLEELQHDDPLLRARRLQACLRGRAELLRRLET